MQLYGAKAVNKQHAAGFSGYDAITRAAAVLRVNASALERSINVYRWSAKSTHNADLDNEQDADFSVNDTLDGFEESRDDVLTHEKAGGFIAILFDDAGLSERDRLILAARTGEEKASFDKLSLRLGVSRERVRQIEMVAYAKLREAAARRGLTFQDLW